MPDECSKAIARRHRDPAFGATYFAGDAIDVCAGGDGLSRQRADWPRLTGVRDWDLPDGDAQELATIPDDTFDVLHSSHGLEHMRDPFVALHHWVRVVRPGGYLVVMVPDEDMYEQGIFPPSTFNGDHKYTFTPYKARSWSLASVSVFSLVVSLGDSVELIKLELLREEYDWTLPRQDQTGGPAPCAIEFILRKRTAKEVLFGGRVGAAR